MKPAKLGARNSYTIAFPDETGVNRTLTMDLGDKHKYFLSALNYQTAILWAKQLGLERHEFVFIGWHDKNRKEKLAGHHKVPLDHLIGEFSPEEKHYLTS